MYACMCLDDVFLYLMKCIMICTSSFIVICMYCIYVLIVRFGGEIRLYIYIETKTFNLVQSGVLTFIVTLFRLSSSYSEFCFISSPIYIALSHYSIYVQYRVETNCIHYFRQVLLLPGVAVSSMVLPISDIGNTLVFLCFLLDKI